MQLVYILSIVNLKIKTSLARSEHFHHVKWLLFSSEE